MKNKHIAVVLILIIAVLGLAYASKHSLAPVSMLASGTMQITSEAFDNNGLIPAKYTCDATTPPSPPLSFSNVPVGAKSLTLIVDDPDVPQSILPARIFDHWVVFNIDPTATGIPEGASVGIPGTNGTGATGFIGPCPPPTAQPYEHRYFFTLYALDSMLPLDSGATKKEVLDAMQGHIMKVTQLIGRYQKMATSTP